MSQAEDVAGGNAVHEEGQAQGVAFGEEVGAVVGVGGDVVGTLGTEDREEFLDGI